MKKIGRIFGVALLCSILFSCSNLLERLEDAAIPLHTVSYESEWGTAPTSVGVLDNTALTQEHLPLLLAVGYTFEGWYCEDTKIEVGYVLHGSITLTAKWSTNTDTPYKVEHYQQNTTDDGYTLFETEEKNGSTDSETLATPKEYTGFIAQSIEQGTILPDGSTVVKVYYDRKVFTLTFDSDGGSEVKSITEKYGTTITAPENPTKEGYSFMGWNQEIPKTMPAENVTYKAQWQENTLGIKVQAPSYSDIPNLATPTISGTTVTFEAPEEYASYSWYIDGVLQDNEHTQSFILDTTNLSARSYYIMLVVVDEKDAVYSAQYELEVTK